MRKNINKMNRTELEKFYSDKVRKTFLETSANIVPVIVRNAKNLSRKTGMPYWISENAIRQANSDILQPTNAQYRINSTLI